MTLASQPSLSTGQVLPIILVRTLSYTSTLNP